jgi:serine/threonine protein kinase
MIDFRGVFRDSSDGLARLFLMFEFPAQGDLLRVVVKNGRLPEAVAQPVFAGIIKGLSYIHSLDIVHRDIKTESIFLKRDGVPVIAEFGVATSITDKEEMSRRCGTPGFIAPEICIGKKYDVGVDLFGAGVTFFFALSCELPFTSPDGDVKKTMKLTVRGRLDFASHHWERKSRHLRQLLRQLMTVNPANRITCQQALQHAFFVEDLQTRKLERMKDVPGSAGPIAALPITAIALSSTCSGPISPRSVADGASSSSAQTSLHWIST